MLVLSRKVGETIVIGEGITVRVTRISGTRVTLGVEAPTDVRIVRGELKPYTDAFGPETPASPKQEGKGRATPSAPPKSRMRAVVS